MRRPAPRPATRRPRITTVSSRRVSGAGRRRSATAAGAAPRSPISARPWRGRNLDVVVDALATRIVFSGRRAVGVEYLRGGDRVVVHAEREVTLAGGVINSPQL